MFTGLVEAIGRVERVEPRGAQRRFWIEAERVREDAEVGDSIAADGCCLTVVALEGRAFVFDAVSETIERTTLGAWTAGRLVNLERSLTVERRLGGHLVQGHVDGVGRVVSMVAQGEGRRATIELPPALRRFVAEKGSLTVDGVSLTVAACSEALCEIAYIPHTLSATVAGGYVVGQSVNVEVDVIARYIARLLDESGMTRRTS